MSTFNVHEWNRKRRLSEEEVNENWGFTKAEVLKMKEDLSNFLDKYSYIMAPVDASKVYDATSILGRLTQHPKVK